MSREPPINTTTMTELRPVDGAGQGLFATQYYAVGDVILNEEPLIRLAPANDAEQARLFDQWKPQKQASGADAAVQSSFVDSLDVPDSIDTTLRGTFRSMVQVAVHWATIRESLSPTVVDRLLELYHPSLSSPRPEEVHIVDLLQACIDYLQEHAADDSPLHALLLEQLGCQRLRRLLLVWAANSFESGRIYETISRLNHSCDPAAVVVADGERQQIQAARPIAAGEEITIAYLSTLLYADHRTRQRLLQRNKLLECRCQRCHGPDRAEALPCVFCHPQTSTSRGHRLDEDIQYDDEQTVHYMRPINAEAFECTQCTKQFVMDGEYRHVFQTARTVSDKVADYVEQTNDDDDDDDGLLEEHLCLASSVLGARHWATNVLLLRQLEQHLQQLHGDLLQNQQEPDMEQIAECIDMLERICRFVDGLELQLHRGHLLSSPVIGVARALVALGDAKSQKYAADWLERLDGYTEHFESPAMQKVVETLRLAWTQHDESVEPDAKKLKAS